MQFSQLAVGLTSVLGITTVLSNIVFSSQWSSPTPTQRHDHSINLGLEPSAPPRLLARAPDTNGSLTIHVTNRHGPGLSITYVNDANSPSALSHPTPGPLKSETNIVYPSRWAGCFTIGKNFNPEASKVEGSFQDLNGQLLPYIDVSYVTGFTVPIVCSCNGEVEVGCNKHLFNYGNHCPLQGYGPICYASPFFEPCSGAAYTYAGEDETGAYCYTNEINCCVGSGCPPSPKQSRKRNLIGGHERRPRLGD